MANQLVMHVYILPGRSVSHKRKPYRKLYDHFTDFIFTLSGFT